MIVKIDEATLRGWVSEGKTDAEIATTLGVSPRTVRRALATLGVKRERAAKGEARGPGYVLRFADEDEREKLHEGARAVGRDTSEWLLALALDGPALARAARHPELSADERSAALDELLTMLAGPEPAN